LIFKAKTFGADISSLKKTDDKTPEEERPEVVESWQKAQNKLVSEFRFDLKLLALINDDKDSKMIRRSSYKSAKEIYKQIQ